MERLSHHVDGGLSVYSVQIHYETINKITFFVVVVIVVVVAVVLKSSILELTNTAMIALRQPPNDSCSLIQMIERTNGMDELSSLSSSSFQLSTVCWNAMCSIRHTCGWCGHFIGLQHIEFKRPANNS